LNKFSKSNLDWEERLIAFYYTALESYVDKLELSEELREELNKEIEDDDYLILAQFLALATKKFLQQEGGLKQEQDWDLLFPHTYYIH